jgi:anti-sigma regulatory factor (Ser/Thr protein kinase)
MRRTVAPVEISVRADPAPTHALRATLDDVGGRCGIPGDDIFDLKVAATEALTNAIQASPDGHGVAVAVEPGRDGIEVEVRNDGIFGLAGGDHADLESERGRGLPLMLALVDEIEFASTGRGTRVRMRKRTRREPGAAYPGL